VTFWLAVEDEITQDDLDAMQRVLESGRRLEVTPREWRTDLLTVDCPHR
jgi:hypothetical protein